MRVVDLGCGTGELTYALHTKLGARETLGIVVRAILQPDALEQHHGLFVNLVAFALLCLHGSEHDVVKDAQMGKEVV